MVVFAQLTMPLARIIHVHAAKAIAAAIVKYRKQVQQRHQLQQQLHLLAFVRIQIQLSVQRTQAMDYAIICL